MRVLALTRSYPNPFLSSYATYNESHFSALRQLIDIDLMVPIPWFRKIFREGNRGSLQGEGITYPTFWYPPRIMAGERWRFYYRSIREAVSRLPRPDLIYGLWVSPDGVACQQLGKDLGLPVVLKSGGSDIHSVDAAAKPITQKALQRAHQLITVSKALGEDAINLGLPKDRLTVVYNGIDQNLFDIRDQATARKHLGLAPTDHLFCCVARLHPVKNIELMIDAFAKMSRQDCQLILIGDGPDRQSLEQRATSSSAGNRIRFVGEKSYEDIAQWMNACDTITLSSHNEGVPNTLVEALSCGRPVVSTQVGGIAEVIEAGTHGALVPPGQINAYAEALDWVSTQSWDRQSIRESIGHRTWAQNARNTLDCFEQVIANYQRR